MQFPREINHNASDLKDAFSEGKAGRIHEGIKDIVNTLIEADYKESEILQKAIELYADDANDVVVITLMVNRMVQSKARETLSELLFNVGERKSFREKLNDVMGGFYKPSAFDERPHDISVEERIAQHEARASTLKIMPDPILADFKSTHNCDECEKKDE